MALITWTDQATTWADPIVLWSGRPGPVFLDPPTIIHNGSAVSCFSVLLPLEITHGRSGISKQPDAPTATFTWYGTTCPLALNDSIEIEATIPDPDGTPVTVPRFAGKVARVKASQAGGLPETWEVECIGNLADWGMLQVDRTFVEQNEADRVLAVAAAVGEPITLAGSTDKMILQDGVDRDALSVLHELAEWGSSLVWEGRDGSVHYGFANHRATTPTAVLPPCSMGSVVDWETDRDDVLNHVTVKYGDPETQNTYVDQDSIDAYGFRHAEVSTKLRDQDTVDEFGQTVLIRRKEPYWVISDLLWDSSLDNDHDAAWTMNNLDVGAGVMLSVPPEPGPVGQVPDAWTLEGWVETWERPGVQRFQLAVSDRRRWGVYALRRWREMDDETWQHWIDNGSWLDLLAAPVA